MDTVPTMSPAPAPVPARSHLISTSILTGLVVLFLLTIVGFLVFDRAEPEAVTFPVIENGVTTWYALSDHKLALSAQPSEYKSVPANLLQAGEFSAVYAENGDVVALSPVGLVAFGASGTRTTLIERAGPDYGSSAVAADASAAVLFNTVTNALDVYLLDRTRPAVLSFVGSIPVEGDLFGVAFADPSRLLVRTSENAFTIYDVATLKANGNIMLKGETAFLSTPVAHAYTYGNPLTSTGAITTSGKRCTGTFVASLGSSGGVGTMPSVQTTVWNNMGSQSNLPSNYNQAGTYCIQAQTTVVPAGGGGGGGGGSNSSSFNNEAFLALLGVSKAYAAGGSWTIDFGIYSGTGSTNATDYYTLTYTAAATATLQVSPSPIDVGNSASLTWSSSNATSCTPTNFATGGALSGTISVSPSSSTTYSITCTGTGSASASATLTVVSRPNLTSSAPVVTPGTNGAATTFNATVHNGGVAASGASSLLFQYSSTANSTNPSSAGAASIGTIAVNGDAQGSSSRVFPGGTYYMRACADNGNAVDESNESDNCSSWTQFTVAAAPSPGASCTDTAYQNAVWYTGTPVGSYTERLNWSGEWPVCPSSAYVAGSGVPEGSTFYWNREVRYDYGPFGIGVEDPYTVTCTYFTSVTGTESKPTRYGTPIQGHGSSDFYYASGQSTCSAAGALSATCSASPSNSATGQAVTWTAVPSGGTSPYTYAWSGTDSLTGSTISVQKTYSTNGTKSGQVQIGDAAGGSITAICSPSAVVGGTQCTDGLDNDADGLTDTNDPDCTGPGDTTEGAGGPSLSCGVSPASVSVGGSATYTASVTGGSGTYTYAFTPLDGQSCTGSGASRTCTFPTEGNARMDVTATGTGNPSGNCTVVSVAPACSPSSVTISASPDRVVAGTATTLTWSSDAGCSCSISGPSGVISTATSGSQAVTVSKQSIFTATCSGTTKSVLVNVVPRFQEF